MSTNRRPRLSPSFANVLAKIFGSWVVANLPASFSETIWSTNSISESFQTLLGEGILLFPSRFPQRDFTLVENKSYAQGMISLKYRRSMQKRQTKGRA